MADTQQFAALLSPILRELFDTHYNAISHVHEKIFLVLDAELETERTQGITGPLLPIETDEDAEAPGADAYLGFAATFGQKTYARSFRVTNRMALYNLKQPAFDRAIALGRGAALKVEKSALDIINGCETAVTGAPNSEALVETTHAVPTGAAGSAQSNKGTAALAHSALSTAITAMMKFTDDQGEKVMVVPKILLVPVDLQFTAAKIVNSVGESDAVDNNINTLNPAILPSITGVAGGLQVVSSPLLTDVDAWFLIDPDIRCLRLYWGERPVMLDEFEKKTRSTIFSVWEDFVVGYSDWRGIYGSIPA